MRSRAYMRFYWSVVVLIGVLALIGGLISTQIMK